MAKIHEILTKAVNDDEHQREIGRYWASELYSIIKGYLKPEDYFKKKEVDLKGCQMILTGEAMEEKLWEILKKFCEVNYQTKKEIKITDEITLVVQSDFEFPDFIVETKFPFHLFKSEIPERYCYQLEAQYRTFKKRVYLGILSVPFNLELIEYIPSDKRWEKIKRSLTEFHKKVKLCQKENTQKKN